MWIALNVLLRGPLAELYARGSAAGRHHRATRRQ